jgi:hypothetical protein
MKKYFAFALITLFAVSVFPVYAVEGKNEDTRAQKKEDMLLRKQERVETRCTISENKIKGIVSTYESNKTSWEKLISNTEEVLNKMEAKLKAAGADTTKLVGYIAELKTLMQKSAAAKDAVIAKLREGQNLACGEANGEYKSRLQEARQLRTTLVADRKAARQYFINTVKPEIKRLRDTVNGKKVVETKETTEETEN